MARIIWKNITDEMINITEEGKIFVNDNEIHGHLSTNGYMRVYFKGEQKLKHRIIAEKFVPNPKELPEVNHIDGDKLNNHYTNLEWVSHQDNVLHGYEKGLFDDKVKAKRKLTNNELKQVRELLSKKVSLRTIARQFDISLKGIWNISKNIYYNKTIE